MEVIKDIDFDATLLEMNLTEDLPAAVTMLLGGKGSPAF